MNKLSKLQLRFAWENYMNKKKYFSVITFKNLSSCQINSFANAIRANNLEEYLDVQSDIAHWDSVMEQDIADSYRIDSAKISIVRRSMYSITISTESDTSHDCAFAEICKKGFTYEAAFVDLNNDVYGFKCNHYTDEQRIEPDFLTQFKPSFARELERFPEVSMANSRIEHLLAA